MKATSISSPIWDKHRRRYVVRWSETDEDGTTRRRTDTRSQTKAAAEALRRRLRGDAVEALRAARVRGKGQATRSTTRARSTSDDERAWAVQLVWYRERLGDAVDVGDADGAELVAKGSRACATLATASAAIRDLKKLKTIVAELETWRKNLLSAGVHGTRVDAAAPRGGSAERDLQPGDAVH
jgi:hypothetical protein